MSNPIKTESKIQVYEKQGRDLKFDEREDIVVKNHWNRKALVVLIINDIAYTVASDELERAISNARNAHKF